MITKDYAITMAAYNRWQNDSLYGAADRLGDEARREARGAFFGSIHGTLNHVLWGDKIWMHRFAGTPLPRKETIASSVYEFDDWSDLKAARAAHDALIENWAKALDQAWLEGDVSWRSSVVKGMASKPAWFLVVHFFNHQTHHRGQVHAMLTAAGAEPNDTDLFVLPGAKINE